MQFIDHEYDGFGIFASEHGIQKTNLLEDPLNFDFEDVRGWNGFAYHRTADGSLKLGSFHVKPEQMTDQLDLYDRPTLSEEFLGMWHQTSWMMNTSRDGTEQYIQAVVDRYQPKWVHGRYESWDNDYRIDPNSPHIRFRGYTRRDGFDKEVEWFDIISSTLNGASSMFESLTTALVLSIWLAW
jgi:hypothetical protein